MADGDNRNVGVIGAPNSGANEVFDAILRFDQTPKPKTIGWWDESVVIWEEEVKPPYDAKRRKKLFGDE